MLEKDPAAYLCLHEDGTVFEAKPTRELAEKTLKSFAPRGSMEPLYRAAPAAASGDISVSADELEVEWSWLPNEAWRGRSGQMSERRVSELYSGIGYDAGDTRNARDVLVETLDAYVSARAALARRPAEGWRDMASAPQQGWVDLWHREGWRIPDAERLSVSGALMWADAGGKRVPDEDVLYWMPLPAPPRDEGGER